MPIPDSCKLRVFRYSCIARSLLLYHLLQVGQAAMKISRLPTLLALLASTNIPFLRITSVAAQGRNDIHRRMASQQSLSASDWNGTRSHRCLSSNLTTPSIQSSRNHSSNTARPPSPVSSVTITADHLETIQARIPWLGSSVRSFWNFRKRGGMI